MRRQAERLDGQPVGALLTGVVAFDPPASEAEVQADAAGHPA
jgi:hypothetical protein